MGRLAFCEIKLSYLILYIQGHSLVFVHNKTKETPSNVVEIMRRAIDYLTNKAITDHILQNKTDLSHKIFNEAISSKTHQTPSSMRVLRWYYVQNAKFHYI